MNRNSLVAVVACVLSLPLFGEDIVLPYQGRQVILHEDKTWEYAQTPQVSADQSLVLTKNQAQTTQITSPTKKYRINFNPELWDQTKPSNADAEFGFQNKTKDGFAMAIFDGLELPLESMEQVLIINAKNIDPNARILEKKNCIVNGTPGELVTYTATGSGIPFTLLSFITAGPFGSIQFTFYTSTAAFPRLRSDFTDAISGIEF